MSDLTPRAGGELVANTDPFALVQAAMANEIDAAALDKIVALAERIDDRNAEKAFSHAKARFQGMCPTIRHNRDTKTATGGGGNYGFTYADLPQVVGTIRPALDECGLSFRWDTAVGERTMTVTCTVRHIDGHEESSSFEGPIDANKARSAVQNYGSTETYAQRRSLLSALGITTADGDTDAAPEPVETVTQRQADNLRDWADKLEVSAKLLAAYGWGDFEDIPASKYETVRGRLQSTEDKKGGA